MYLHVDMIESIDHRLINLITGKPIAFVMEADDKAGWYIQLKTKDNIICLDSNGETIKQRYKDDRIKLVKMETK